MKVTVFVAADGVDMEPWGFSGELPDHVGEADRQGAIGQLMEHVAVEAVKRAEDAAGAVIRAAYVVSDEIGDQVRELIRPDGPALLSVGDVFRVTGT